MRWCPAAGKVTVGLASHWPRVTDFSDLCAHLRAYGLKREMSTPPTHSSWGMALLYLFSVPIPSGAHIRLIYSVLSTGHEGKLSAEADCRLASPVWWWWGTTKEQQLGAVVSAHATITVWSLRGQLMVSAHGDRWHLATAVLGERARSAVVADHQQINVVASTSHINKAAVLCRLRPRYGFHDWFAL